MADYNVFNPQQSSVPIPDYTRISRPISDVEPNKAGLYAGQAKGFQEASVGETLKGIGEGVAGVAKTAEDTFEGWMKEHIHAGVDALRESTTKAYENIRNAQATGQQPDPQAVQTAGFAGGGGSQDVPIPPSLQAGLDKATQLGIAKSQRGAANDTLYTAALNSMAKQLRSQYPGHRDFIDEQISRITGINPANAYMQNLLVDINRSGRGEDFQQKLVMDLTKKYIGNPDVQHYYTAVQAGVPNAMQGLTTAVYKAAGRDYQHQTWQQTHEESGGDLSADADLAKRQYTKQVGQAFDESMNPVLAIPGLTSPQKMSQMITDTLQGKITLTGPQQDQLVQNLKAAKIQFLQRTADIETKQGFNTRINDSTWTKQTRDNIAAGYDHLINAVMSKSDGSMFMVNRKNEWDMDESTQQAFSSPMGQWLKDRSVLSKYLGPNLTNVLDSISLQKGTNTKQLQEFFSRATTNSAVPPDMRQDQNVKSLYDSLSAAKNASKLGYDVPQVAYDNLVDNVNNIKAAVNSSDPKAKEVAKNIVDYMFDPSKNQKLMQFFGRDFVDDNGVSHKGKFAVYDTMTDPDIADAIFSLHDKDAWQKYKDWQEISFKQLFGEEANNLNQFQGKAFPSTLTLNWDNKNNRFFLTGPAYETLQKMDPGAARASLSTLPTDVRYAYEAQRSITALNGGLHNLSYMHNLGAKDTTGTSEYLFDMMMGMGYNPTNKLHGDDFPQRALQAITASARPQAAIENAFRSATERRTPGSQ